MFTQLLQTSYQTLHLSSPVRAQMKCHSSDLAMFLIVSFVTCSVCLSVFQPALLKAIFNVDPDEVRSLIFKKEDVNVQVRK